jgi:hypothetical protein
MNTHPDFTAFPFTITAFYFTEFLFAITHFCLSHRTIQIFGFWTCLAVEPKVLLVFGVQHCFKEKPVNNGTMVRLFFD